MSIHTAVVIPSHREGTSIIQTLAGVARAAKVVQHDVSTRVLIVINASAGSSEDVRASNGLTANLVHELLVGRLPDGLNTQSPTFVQANLRELFPSAWMTEVEAGQSFLADRGDHLTIESIIHTPEKCNVGIARNAGVRHILSAGDAPGKIVMMDGDTQVTINHIGYSADTSREPFIHGPRVSLCPTDLQDQMTEINRNYYVFDYFRSFRESVSIGSQQPLQESSFYLGGTDLEGASRPGMVNLSEVAEGANMVFSPEVFHRLRGFAPLASGEDTDFSHRAQSAGYKPVSHQHLAVATIERFSDRTTSGQGATNERFSGSIHDIKALPSRFVCSSAFRRVLDYLLDHHGKTLSYSKFRKELEQLYTGFRILSQPEWKHIYDGICIDGKIHASADQENFEFLTLLMDTKLASPLVDELASFDRDFEQERRRLGIQDRWEVFYDEVCQYLQSCQ